MKKYPLTTYFYIYIWMYDMLKKLAIFIYRNIKKNSSK